MARTKRSRLPKVSEVDLITRPEQIRPTPNGGHAWRCYYCGHYASSETLAGRYVCRRHGGVTPKQRDPILRLKWQQRTGKRPRPPGRPIEHGYRCRGGKVKLSEVLRQQYEQNATYFAQCSLQIARARKQAEQAYRNS